MEKGYHYKLIEKAIRFIADNYRLQPNLEEVAEQVHLSKYHFQRLFQEWAGVTPKQFLQFTTVEHAKKCLDKGRSTLATAYEVGLSGNGRLHDVFIKIEARTPGEYQKKGKGTQLKYQKIDSRFGEILVVESEVGICQLSFLKEGESSRDLLEAFFPEADYVNELGKYGKMAERYLSTWKVPKKQIVLDLKGTPFQIGVWKALLSIPSSQCLAYHDVASLVDNPKAIRAVGSAIGKNPIAYLIPCHRVIRETGEMGGYRWGDYRKTIINGFENVQMSNKRIA